MNRIILTVAAAALLLGACGGDDANDNGYGGSRPFEPPELTCAEIQEPGRPTADVQADITGGEEGCAEDGGTRFVGWQTHSCADGREVFVTEDGWGIVGEAWQAGAYPGSC